MNKLQNRIEELEILLRKELEDDDIINGALTRGEIMGIRFAQQEILKIIKNISFVKADTGERLLFADILEKQIKNEN